MTGVVTRVLACAVTRAVFQAVASGVSGRIAPAATNREHDDVAPPGGEKQR